MYWLGHWMMVSDYPENNCANRQDVNKNVNKVDVNAMIAPQAFYSFHQFQNDITKYIRSIRLMRSIDSESSYFVKTYKTNQMEEKVIQLVNRFWAVSS